MSRMLASVEPMHDRCGAASEPEAWISHTVSRVRSRVEPPAPKVTEKNLGLSSASCLRVARSFSVPSAVMGGKTSKLNVRSDMLRPLDWGLSADSAQAFTLYRFAPTIADTNPCTLKPGSSALASQYIWPFRIR